jgi:uncharacterized protein
MEEILASIRRIIADDEAKPVVAEAPPPPPAPKPVPPAPKPVAMADIPPSAIPAAQAAVAKAAAPPPPPAPKPAPAPEPAVSNSQDDIDAMLASLEAATTEEEVRPAQPDGDVFELTDDMMVAEPEPAFQHVEPDDDLEFAEAVAASNERSTPRFDPPSYDAPPAAPQQQILSHSTVSSVESAFNALANTVLSNNARTLEDLVKEMLRPMLKSWLDDNLPGLVERIVKAEIERVSRGSR